MANPTTDDLRESLLARIRTDTTFKTLTGATSQDPRLYYRFQPNPVLSPTQKVYATYFLLGDNERIMGVLEPIYAFTLWARDTEVGYEALRDVRNRIHTLVDRQTWTVGSDIVQGRNVREMDTDDPPNGFIGRVLHLRVAALDRVA